MKKLLALCLVFALALCVPAFAEENIVEDVKNAVSTLSDGDLSAIADMIAAEQAARAEARRPQVTITMESGDEIHLELYPEIAPNTVANFVTLAQSGFYDGVIFHRVIPGFMIQGGDPQGNGTGGPGYTIKGEFTANGFANPLSHSRGVISMARRGSGKGGNNQGYDTAGCQFFIMHADYTGLDGLYAAFGKVTDEESLAVVDKIAAAPTDSNDKPVDEWRIKTITVDTKGIEYQAETIKD